MKKRVLVTGACGFIGAHVTKKLVDMGYAVHGVDDMTGADYEFFVNELSEYHVRTVPIGVTGVWERQKESLETADIVVFEGDFTDPRIIRRLDQNMYSAVIHLAAEPSVQRSVEYPVSTYENNLQKTVELFHICAKTNTKVVFASSAAVYGSATHGLGAAREDMATEPLSPYALQKLQAEQVGTLFSSLYGLSITTLRFFNVYGPGQKGDSPYSTVIASWTERAKQKLPLRLDGDGEQTRDYIHVYDVARACVSALEYTGTAILNIASGVSVSNNKILAILENYRNIEIINAPQRKGDIRHSRAAVKNAELKLNFAPAIQLRDGIEGLLGQSANE